MRRTFHGVLFFFLWLSLTLFVSGVFAGNLDPPSGPPSPSMKTLDQVPPTWDRVLSGPQRFKTVMMRDEAVLDYETGLVWQRTAGGDTAYSNAPMACYNAYTGGRGGWRLPTIEDLRSLMDQDAAYPPALPQGNPFQNVGSCCWSTTPGRPIGTEETLLTVSPWGGGSLRTLQKNALCGVWCVRGGNGSGK